MHGDVLEESRKSHIMRCICHTVYCCGHERGEVERDLFSVQLLEHLSCLSFLERHLYFHWGIARHVTGRFSVIGS